MDNTQAEAQERARANEWIGKVVRAFRNRQLDVGLDWHRFEWTKGAGQAPCVRLPAYLGSRVIGLNPAGWYTFQNRDGGWMECHPDRPDWLVDMCIEELAGFVPELPRRSDR